MAAKLDVDFAEGSDLKAKRLALAGHFLKVDAATLTEKSDEYVDGILDMAEARADAADTPVERTDGDSNPYILTPRGTRTDGVPDPVLPDHLRGAKVISIGGAS